MAQAVLSVRNLSTSFRLRSGWYAAVRDISFNVMENETLCLVGESGCGKSITAISAMGLLAGQPGCRVSGEVWFDGKDLATLSDRELRHVRGNRLAMIFQEPMTSLNPVLTIGQQVGEPLIYHRAMTRREADREAVRLLELVKIPDAGRRLNQYPHQFSGGMRQRVMIAMALACGPDILFADEPTTALDVTIQSQVLSLLGELRDEQAFSLVLITHDLGVVATIADRVAVMYAGEIVELAPTAELFAAPRHPYTEALLKAIPRSDRDTAELRAIDGQVPPIYDMPPGCRFAPRCALREEICARELPELLDGPGPTQHLTRCHVRARVFAPSKGAR
ncbi:MAG: ABC transporter ATP-binding protein [Burkholderiaceae bacterium]|nr:ABC transporter ATP-binding protein [Burkholderiaceae bacterium]